MVNFPGGKPTRTAARPSDSFCSPRRGGTERPEFPRCPERVSRSKSARRKIPPAPGLPLLCRTRFAVSEIIPACPEPSSHSPYARGRAGRRDRAAPDWLLPRLGPAAAPPRPPPPVAPLRPAPPPCAPQPRGLSPSPPPPLSLGPPPLQHRRDCPLHLLRRPIPVLPLLLDRLHHQLRNIKGNIEIGPHPVRRHRLNLQALH